MKKKTEEEEKEDVLKELERLIDEANELQRQYDELKKDHPEVAHTRLGQFFGEPNNDSDGNS